MRSVFSAFLCGYAFFRLGGCAGSTVACDLKTPCWGCDIFWSLFYRVDGPRAKVHSRPLCKRARTVPRDSIFSTARSETATSPKHNKIAIIGWALSHRGTGASFTILGVGLGGAITPPLIAWIMQKYGWRMAFYWAERWAWASCCCRQILVTSTPEENPRVNAEELAQIAVSELASRRVRGAPADALGHSLLIRFLLGTLPRIFLPRLPAIYFTTRGFFDT